MKRFNRWKTLQLIAYIALGVISLVLLFTNKDLYHWVANEMPVRLLCIILWVVFVISVIGILYDFSFSARSKRDYNELDFAIYSDPVSGLANRNSCDVYIEKYRGRALPDNFCCIVFDLMNLATVNRQKGHAAGNEMIRDYANILSLSAKLHEDASFIGRNSGNQFLTFFENIDSDHVLKILDDIDTRVQAHNHLEPNKPIEYRYGVAYNNAGECNVIGELVSSAIRNTN